MIELMAIGSARIRRVVLRSVAAKWAVPRVLKLPNAVVRNVVS